MVDTIRFLPKAALRFVRQSGAKRDVFVAKPGALTAAPAWIKDTRLYELALGGGLIDEKNAIVPQSAPQTEVKETVAAEVKEAAPISTRRTRAAANDKPSVPEAEKRVNE